MIKHTFPKMAAVGAVVALSLTACGSDSEDDAPSDDPATTEVMEDDAMTDTSEAMDGAMTDTSEAMDDAMEEGEDAMEEGEDAMEEDG